MRSHALSDCLCSLVPFSDAPNRVTALEGTRGLAMSLIFYFHFHAVFSAWLQPDSAARQASVFLATACRCGTDMFLVISGYLIYGQLIRKPIEYGRYVRRRLWRLYPTFLCVICIYILLSLVLPEHSKLPGGFGPAALYVAQNVALLPGLFPSRPIMAVSWTLSVLLLFYLTIPIVINQTGMRRWERGSRCAVFAAAGIVLLVLSEIFDPSKTRLFMLIVGIFAYESVQSETIRMIRNGTGEKLALALAAPVLIVSFLLRTPGQLADAWLAQVLRTVAVATMLYWIAVYSFGFRGTLHRLLSATALRWLGNISYSYYLIHGLTLLGLRSALYSVFPSASGTGFFLIVLPLAYMTTLTAAAVLFMAVEKPLSVWRQQAAKDAQRTLRFGVIPMTKSAAR